MNEKPWYLSKTVVVNVVATIAALYELFAASPIFPQEVLPYFLLVVGVLNVILRVWFTSQPLK